MKLNQITLHANQSFSYSIFGWNITTPPPSPSGNGDFAQPAPPGFLDSANSQMIQPQAIDFTTPNPGSTQYLSMADSGGGFESNPGGGYWWFDKGGAYVDFALQLSAPTVVNFILTIAAVAEGSKKLNCPISIYVNNKQVVHQYAETSVNWHPQTFMLESDWLQAGSNTIRVRMSDEATTPLWLQSVGVSTEAVPVTASYMWSQVASGQVNPGDTFKRTILIQTGDTSSETDTLAFAEAISTEVSASGGDIFEGVSAKLSTTFTASQSVAHTITITDLQTSGYEVDVTPAGDDVVTFQIWQLSLQYEAGGKQLIQNLGADNGPIIVTQYPPS